MTLLALILAAGCLVGYSSRGRLTSLRQLRLRHLRLLAVALAMQLCLGFVTRRVDVPWAARTLMTIASDLLVGIVLVANARGRPAALRCGLGLAAAGWLANLVPIVAYGGMPVSSHALELAGFASSLGRQAVDRGHLGKHLLVRHAGTVPQGWLLLGDWVPLRALHSVVSPGDVLMAAGIVLTVAAAMHLGSAPPSAGAELGASGSDRQCDRPGALPER